MYRTVVAAEREIVCLGDDSLHPSDDADTDHGELDALVQRVQLSQQIHVTLIGRAY